MKTISLLIFIFNLSIAQANAPTDKRFLGFCYGKTSKEMAFYPKPDSPLAPLFKSKFEYNGVEKVKGDQFELYTIRHSSDLDAVTYFEEKNGFLRLADGLWVPEKDVEKITFNRLVGYKSFWFKDPKYLYSSPKRTPLKKDLYDIVSKSPQFKGKEVREVDGEFFILFEKFVRPGCKEEDDMGGAPADSCFITPKEEIWMPLFSEKGERLFFFRYHNEWIESSSED